MYKALLVDDDPILLRFLGEHLQGQGFAVIAAASGTEALRSAYRERPDIVVLDVMMPGMDGWETCARLRELANIPVILLTAKSSEADKLRGFRLGVDDYVTKPFSFSELTARIEAVLVRTETARGQARHLYALGDLIVDMDKREVRVEEKAVPVTPTEFRLLACLAEKQGQAVSEDDLHRAVWGPNREEEETGVVRRYIWLLRQKLEADPAHPTRLLTVRGFGYRLNTGPLRPPPAK